MKISLFSSCLFRQDKLRQKGFNIASIPQDGGFYSNKAKDKYDLGTKDCKMSCITDLDIRLWPHQHYWLCKNNAVKICKTLKKQELFIWSLTPQHALHTENKTSEVRLQNSSRRKKGHKGNCKCLPEPPLRPVGWVLGRRVQKCSKGTPFNKLVNPPAN